ncbi:protein-disulfide reductase DsbD family protein [Acetobacter suratthaniensis]|uniref:Thioredoxin family protein n=1 Tax=Acetobacter suratthaniensis TaxID=1502841 RepID=A0ABS3LMU4_9PROT|nr:protein-disulfide reductase DsbD domain-containing protein [Acetobacter suratthaniensis]MBO1328684.1 thioredoxin family protein [Acetobacter suratthaniensis]MCX2566866.1 protein-disulfide reductase DsbD family protein [Acetobacter suratthaniensis]
MLFVPLLRLCRASVVLPVLLSILVAGMLSGAVRAAESSAVITPHTVATLITGTDTAQAGSTLPVALRLRLQPGWHTYWRNPGDAGEPVAVQVQAQGALVGQADTIIWPTPLRIRAASLMSYAYMGDVVLPLSLPLAPPPGHDAGETVVVHAHASWLVCAVVCVPEEAELSLSLPRAAPATGGQAASAQAGLFASAARATPGVSPYQAALGTDGVMRLSGPGLSAQTVRAAWFMADEPGLIDPAAPQNERVQEGAVLLHLKPLPDFTPGHALSGVMVLQSPTGVEQAVAQTVSRTAGPIEAAAGAAAGVEPVQGALTAAIGQAGGHGFAQIMRLAVFGLLGGLVLNLMPCVFPVLAMKALSVARLGRAGRQAQLWGGAGYALGVLATFMALGGGMMALRAGGRAAGWGFQFQSPLFVTFVTWLLFVMALNLLGVFSFLPFAMRAPRQAQGETAEARLRWHDVLTGVLAVLVATPCTAPFMGVAVAGALAGPPVAGLVVFAFMGVGLAAPLVLLMLAPGIAGWLPRPGGWMIALRQSLAFPLLGTCVWFVWVIVMEGGGQTVLPVGAGLVFLGFACWLYGVAQAEQARTGHSRAQAALHGLALLGFLAAMALLPTLRAQSATQGAGMALPEGVEAFTPARFAALRAQGEPVFVDMTAAWCMTCLVNERLVLDTQATRTLFARRGVHVLRGDWTRHDPAITAFLSAHGRDGVPLYVYAPAHGAETVLPQVLTPGILARALDGAP